MCGPMIAMAGLMAGNALVGDRENSKALGAQIAAQNAQKVNMIRTMNYDLVQLDQQQRDSFEDAVTQLQSNSINAIRNQGMIEAAFGESGVEGRSVDAVLREVRGQDARVADSVRENFAKDARGVKYNKELAVLNTDAQIKGLPVIKGPSMFSRVLGVVTAGVQGAAMGASMSTAAAKMGTTGANIR